MGNSPSLAGHDHEPAIPPPSSLTTRTGHMALLLDHLGTRAVLLHGPPVVLAGFYTRKRVTTTQCDLHEQGRSRS